MLKQVCQINWVSRTELTRSGLIAELGWLDSVSWAWQPDGDMGVGKQGGVNKIGQGCAQTSSTGAPVPILEKCQWRHSGGCRQSHSTEGRTECVMQAVINGVWPSVGWMTAKRMVHRQVRWSCQRRFERRWSIRQGSIGQPLSEDLG